MDFLKGEVVKRPIPDCETLELADPRDAIRAEYVWLRGLVEPDYFLDVLYSPYKVHRGERGAKRLPPRGRRGAARGGVCRAHDLHHYRRELPVLLRAAARARLPEAGLPAARHPPP